MGLEVVTSMHDRVAAQGAIGFLVLYKEVTA